MSAFLDALRARAAEGFVPVIPDFKMVSPAEGPLFAGRDPVDAAKAMAAAGAPVLSVVTEKEHFGGSPALLREIAAAAGVPVLRKDFIRSVEDVEETAACGASAVLLICASMPEGLLRRCRDAARDLGLEPLAEAHTAAELRFAASLGCPLLGINNRDILALEKDGGTVERTAALAGWKPSGAFLISESGLRSPDDVRRAVRSGADGVLVGTAIWRAADPFAFYDALSRAEAEA
jgi:indole-3-glycerol phosphate synthase